MAILARCMITPVRSAIATRTTIPFALGVVRQVFAERTPAEAMCLSCPELVAAVEQTADTLHIRFKPLGGALGLEPQVCRLATKTTREPERDVYALTNLDARPTKVNPWDCVLDKVRITLEGVEEGPGSRTEIRMKLSMYNDPGMPTILRRLPTYITKKLAAGLKGYILSSVHGAWRTACVNLPSSDQLPYGFPDARRSD